MHYIQFIITSLIWGSGFFLMKEAGVAFGPLTIAAGSTFGGSVVLWSFWMIRRRAWQISRRQIIPLLIVALFGYIYPYCIQPFLVMAIGHGFIGMMVSLVPVLTIAVSIPMLKAMPSRPQLFGVMVGLICMGLIIVDGLDRHAPVFYLFLAMLVPLFYAIANTLVQKSFQKTPPLVLAAMLMSITTLVVTPAAITFESVRVNDRLFIAIGAMIILAIFARGTAMLLFYSMIKEKGSLFAGMVTYVIPVEALLWSWLDSERVTVMQVSAIFVVLLMVGIVQRDIVRRSAQSTLKHPDNPE